MNLEERVARLERSNRRYRVAMLAVLGVAGVCLMGGAEQDDVRVVQTLRAGKIEIWDKDRGGFVLNVEDEIRRVHDLAKSHTFHINEVRTLAKRLYEQSPLKMADDIERAEALNAQLAAEQEQAMLDEIRALRMAIQKAAQEAKSAEDQRRLDAMLHDTEDTATLDELKRIRRELDELNGPY